MKLIIGRAMECGIWYMGYGIWDIGCGIRKSEKKGYTYSLVHAARVLS
jgi:hypothetical protein